MKIIYLTDIHGDFERVKQLLSETVADLYIIGGDLIDIPFYNMESSIRYYELQLFFHGLRSLMGKEDLLLEDFVDMIMNDPSTDEDIQFKGTRYQQYTIRARRVMQQKYKVLKNIISIKLNSRVLCLPGNYDMDLRYTSLHENDLHLHWYTIDDLRICGYGGADVWTAGVPERYIVKYLAGVHSGGHESQNEMFRFFRTAKPHIIVTHQPAYGINDRLASGGPFGSSVLRSYCDSHPAMLCMTGHIHGSWGVHQQEGTIYMNPSNFGEITATTGHVFEGGFFYQIEIDQNQVKSIIFKKFNDGRIHDVADYYLQNGIWVEEIIDPERYQALKDYRNVDSPVVKYSHVPEIQLFKEIKDFFRTFQTPETEERVTKMEEVVKIAEDKIKGDIAMDVMGSVNIGLSQQNSDIDFVLYLKCDSVCPAYGQCKSFKQAKTMIKKILDDKYEFQILDCVDLNKVMQSIVEKNYECETLQRFVTYRSLCRPINYRAIAPIEDMLNQDIVFRKEVEGSIQSYFKIFSTTSQHMRSLRKYESRLNSIGIKLPDSIRRKIDKHINEG